MNAKLALYIVGGVALFIAFLLIAGVPFKTIMAVAVVGAMGWALMGDRSSKPARSNRKATPEESAAAAEAVKRAQINQIINDPRLSEDQRNTMLRHLLDTPVSSPSAGPSFKRGGPGTPPSGRPSA